MLAAHLDADPEHRREWERTALARAVAVALIAYRAEHGLSQTALAQRIGMSQPAIARLENSVRPGPTDAWYVLVEAGPEQAGIWRDREHWKSPLPDLMFPADRSWLVSTLWDDDWMCIGGSRGLVRAFLAHPDLRHRTCEVDLSLKDATPLGHTAI